jgi:hypothetical protein
MILVVTSRGDRTADLVEAQFEARGEEYVRLETETFGTGFTIEFHVTGSSPTIMFKTGVREFLGSEVTSIWYRRPLPPVPSEMIRDAAAREFARAELSSLLDGALFALDCCWVSHPSAIRLASHKMRQLTVAAKCGFEVPETCVTMAPARVREFCAGLRSRGKQTAAKLVSKGPPTAPSPEQQYAVYTTLLGEEDLQGDSALAACPAIYQEYIEKKFELRVTVVGKKVFACEIHSQATESTRVDWRRYDLDHTPHLPCELEPNLSQRCLALTREFGLAFAAIDLIVCPDGRVVFLEVNPNGQWGWIEELTGLPIARAVADLLVSGHA